MPLKWLGVVLVLVTALAYGIAAVRRFQTAKGLLTAWVALLRYAYSQLSGFGTPMDEVLAHAPPDMLAPLIRVQGRSAQTRELALLCRASASMLTGEGARLLGELADELGRFWRREQIERLRVYADALEGERARLCAALPGRVRLHGALSLCGALALILLLW